jgi:hypothetical protein
VGLLLSAFECWASYRNAWPNVRIDTPLALPRMLLAGGRVARASSVCVPAIKSLLVGALAIIDVCRACGARNFTLPCTQPFRAGLQSFAPPALNRDAHNAAYKPQVATPEWRGSTRIHKAAATGLDQGNPSAGGAPQFSPARNLDYPCALRAKRVKHSLDGGWSAFWRPSRKRQSVETRRSDSE